jgi:uncharacterized repeat protein (TIGR03803 family)
MLRRTFLGERGAMLVLLVLGVLLGAARAQKESVLYNFCSQSECVDGASPYAGVDFDQKGNLYGTTRSGGANNSCGIGCGVVFKLTPKGKETVLYSFCAQTGCADGYEPVAGLVFDQKGNLYGTTTGGGRSNDGCDEGTCGVVFKLTPKGKYTVLYSFCAQTNCADGYYPVAGLVFDQKGNLYGTTSGGGTYNNTYCPYEQGCGVVFKLTPKGKYTVLYSFCAETNCADGASPKAGLVFDQRGNLYGTAYGGEHDAGVVFRLTPKGKETVLYNFCEEQGCADGQDPEAAVVLDQKGNLYGTTAGGGEPRGGGVVFKLTPEGRETVLYSFCWQNDCADGTGPSAGLVFDQSGNMYGTTPNGGEHDAGVVFKLTPKGKETVLYSFCGQRCAYGASPSAGLIFDQKGNLYGTTQEGGEDVAGVVFKITP